MRPLLASVVSIVLAMGVAACSLLTTEEEGASASDNRSPRAIMAVELQGGLEVELDASGSEDPDGSITRYAWEFGDEETGEGSTVRHVYEASGTYIVRLEVTDDDGATGATTQRITIRSPLDSPSLYWTDSQEGTLRRSGLDGSDARTLMENLSSPQGLALDPATETVYWVESGSGVIRRADIGGRRLRDVETLVEGRPAPIDIALDLAAETMYWTDWSSESIWQANLDGSQVQLVRTGRGTPQGLAWDAQEGRLYWTEANPGSIWRARPERSAEAELVRDGLSSPLGLTLDRAEGTIYWTSLGEDRIRRMNMSGSSPETIMGGLSAPKGVVIDADDQTLYWGEHGRGTIARRPLKGAGGTQEVLVNDAGGVEFLRLWMP